MERLPDLQAFGWIEAAVDRLLPAGHPTWRGHFVSHCLPPGFPAYAKLLHPIREDLSIRDRTLTWAEAERATGGPPPGNVPEILHQVLTQSTLVRGSPDQPFPARRIRWRQLATRYGLPFRPEITAASFRVAFPRSWPRYLVGPDEGTLDEASCQRLVELLGPFTAEQDCYFFYWLLKTETIEDRLYRGHLAEVLTAPDLLGIRGSPTYWWPADHRWCLCTDYDLPFTLIGGPEELVAVLATDPVLECVRVQPSIRIDIYGDQV